MSKIPILDYAFLAFETDSSPKHVGGLQVFKLPKDAPDDFVAQLVARLTAREPEPPFDRRLHRPLLGMPEWRYAEDFDYSDHIFHEQVPEPHTLDALLERISILHAEKLDRTIPLWEIYFFEHLLPNRFALYFKVHHAYMDGISLSRVATAMLSDDPGDLREITLWNLQPRQLSATRRNAVQWLFGNARRAGRAAWALTALARVGFLHGLRGLGLSGRELPIPFTAPRTAFNSRLTRQRSVAVTRLPLSRLQWIADHVGVTVNDVLLELCDSAMSSYLDAHHARPRKPLVAQMPVSLERNGVVQGNQITIALIELGDDEDDPIKRLQRIHQHTHAVKYEFRSMPAEAAELYTVLLQSTAQLAEVAKVEGMLPPLGNVVISNVIGPTATQYLAGAELEAAYPISTIAPGLAINITSYSYDNMLNIGVVTGASAIPDLSLLMQALDAALPMLEKKIGLKPPSATAKPKATPGTKSSAHNHESTTSAGPGRAPPKAAATSVRKSAKRKPSKKRPNRSRTKAGE